MPVAVQVPGLDVFVPEVPDGRIVVLEGGLAPAKSSLARRLARTAAEQGREATLLTTRGVEPAPEVAGLTVHAIDAWPADGALPAGDLLVDSFSLLCLDGGAAAVAARMRQMRSGCTATGRIALLVVDDGQLDAAARAVVHHLADGVLQFLSRDDADGNVSYLRIPKWMDGAPTERNLFYGFTGRQILIDTRRRVT